MNGFKINVWFVIAKYLIWVIILYPYILWIRWKEVLTGSSNVNGNTKGPCLLCLLRIPSSSAQQEGYDGSKWKNLEAPLNWLFLPRRSSFGSRRAVLRNGWLPKADHLLEGNGWNWSRGLQRHCGLTRKALVRGLPGALGCCTRWTHGLQLSDDGPSWAAGVDFSGGDSVGSALLCHLCPLHVSLHPKRRPGAARTATGQWPHGQRWLPSCAARAWGTASQLREQP